MMKIISYEPHHLSQLELQPAQKKGQVAMKNLDYAQQLKAKGPAFSAEIDGRIVACAGFNLVWEGRAIMWALLTEESLQHFHGLFRAGLRLLRLVQLQGIRRIECTVDFEHQAGRDWAERLGFEVEAPRLRGFFPDGSDAVLYAMVTT